MDEPFGLCMNTSTLRPFELGVVEQIEVTAEAGFTAIEPWVRDVVAYRDAGGSVADLQRRISDAGLAVAGAIAFPKWADPDPDVRAASLGEARREMELMAELGGSSYASPPFGVAAETTLDELAEWFRPLAAVGRETGVKPILEFWGMAPRLSTLAEAVYVAAASGIADIQVLVDVYHLYKGGSGHATVGILNGDAIGIVHLNDYPADPPRETIADKDRVFPGDGIAPMDQFLQDIFAAGYRGFLSLELFNADYGDRTPAQVAGEGFAKTRDAVRHALYRS